MDSTRGDSDMPMSRIDDDAVGLVFDDFEVVAADVPSLRSWAFAEFNVWRGSIRLRFELTAFGIGSFLTSNTY